MRTYSAIVDAIELKLRDSSNTYVATTELDNRIVDALRLIARYKQHWVRIPFDLESRRGTATATTAGSLVDSTKGQFLSTDTGKRVYNQTKELWADVISYSDANTLGLSHDIMTSGDNYYIFNKGCYTNKQINLDNVLDYVGDNWGVKRIEYPFGTMVNSFQIDHAGILTMLIREPDDSDPNLTAMKTQALLWINKRHKFSQMDDFAGAIDNGAGYSKGDTTIHVDGLGATAIERDQEFTLANRDQVYTVTAGVTPGGNEADITFYPGLDADVADDVVVTFVQSTLDEELEEILINMVEAAWLTNEANLHLPQISFGGTDTYKRYLDTGNFKMRQVMGRLQSISNSPPASNRL